MKEEAKGSMEDRAPAWDEKYRAEGLEFVGKDVISAIEYRLGSPSGQKAMPDIESAISHLMIFIINSGVYPTLRKYAIEGISHCIRNGMKQSSIDVLGSLVNDMDYIIEELKAQVIEDKKKLKLEEKPRA